MIKRTRRFGFRGGIHMYLRRFVANGYGLMAKGEREGRAGW